MIVKNEAATLERCLAAAQPHVDETVVIDTGSTDGTQAIARRYADVFDEIAWPGSFSAARNVSLDRASGDFVLILDGDEYLEDDHGWRRIRKAIARRDVGAVQLPVLNLMAGDQVVRAERVFQDRVFVNRPDLRYSGRVHNQISDALAAYLRRAGLRAERVNAEIVHTGYALSPEQARVKYEPRLALLEDEWRTNADPHVREYYGFQYANALFMVQRYEDAADLFSRIDYGRLARPNRFYAHLLASQVGLRLRNATMALVHCESMLQLDRDEPMAYFATGMAFLLAGRVGDGLMMLAEAFKRTEEGGRTARFPLNPTLSLQAVATWCRRAGAPDLADRIGRLADAPQLDARAAVAAMNRLQQAVALAERDAA